ncbi:MAG: signal peptidase I [Candidatus Aenigmarchaeota archaeon]|nr:signal peptidase I [Candidatus Aenigmarchaeota archaeon]
MMFGKKNEKKKGKKENIFADIAEVIIAVFAAWLFYQFLIFLLGTPMPVVSVVSSSMYHSSHFDGWWSSSSKYYEKNGMNKTEFEKFTLPNGLSIGDLLVVSKSDYKVGDIVIYNRPEVRYTIVHRIIAEKDGSYVIKGDNNPAEDPGVVKQEQIIGKVNFAIPLVGYPRLALLYLAGV